MVDRSLQRLARLHGVQTAYYDNEQTEQVASRETLTRLLAALGAPLGRPADATDAVRERRLSLWRRTLDPVIVAWDGRVPSVHVRLPAEKSESPFRLTLHLESGETVEWSGNFASRPTFKTATVEGETFVIKTFAVSDPVSLGYHRLTIEADDIRAESLVIAAPQTANETAVGSAKRWGVFLPLYALYRQQGRGVGTFSDLEEMMGWVAEQGGNLLGTLPLLASFGELSDDPSPYSPASRLFWNDFYLDVTRTAEFAQSPEAQAAFASIQSQADRRERLVDYPRHVAAHREVLTALSKQFFAGPAERREGLDRYLQANPRADDYAQFRAACEKQQALWTQWPTALREGQIGPGDYDEEVHRRYLYGQWQVHEQLTTLSKRSREMDLLWYLDLPLGVNVNSYDVWRERELFALGASAGAPPDPFFTTGQNWGFPPIHPERLREQHYRYLISVLRLHLRYAKALRVDHVMGLHRLYWVPQGMSAKHGAYVHYPTEELFAVLTLEARRHQASIVGENLGTVPVAVGRAMDRHRIAGMYVTQFNCQPEPEALSPVGAGSVASINTHDMPTFAAFWKGLDIEDRVDLGLLTREEAEQESTRRAAVRQSILAFLQEHELIAAEDLPGDEEVEPALEGILKHLGKSSAEFVLVSLEDLWQETQPQNTPGTFKERANWQSQARYAFEEFSKLPSVLRLLATLKKARDQAGYSVSAAGAAAPTPKRRKKSAS